ncbi:MAG: hypothetical protein QXS69_01905 [Candidatus Aenigmatarchaeota archaeon]
MKLKMEIDLKDEKISNKIFNSIYPDLKKEKMCLDGSKIVYEIEDENFSHILASCTSILKLINEAIKIERNLEEKKLK